MWYFIAWTLIALAAGMLIGLIWHRWAAAGDAMTLTDAEYLDALDSGALAPGEDEAEWFRVIDPRPAAPAAAAAEVADAIADLDEQTATYLARRQADYEQTRAQLARRWPVLP